MKQEMREVLENNILRFWIDRMQDHEQGGFYGRIDNQNVLHADADKGAILNARILWTFSAAYRVLGKSEYLKKPTTSISSSRWTGRVGLVSWRVTDTTSNVPG